MSNYRALVNYRKFKRNRRRVERVGLSLIGIGLLGVLTVSGEHSSLTLGQIAHTGLCSCEVMWLGCKIVTFIQTIDKEYPLTLNLVEKGDRLCYTISTTKQKASVYNG